MYGVDILLNQQKTVKNNPVCVCVCVGHQFIANACLVKKNEQGRIYKFFF